MSEFQRVAALSEVPPGTMLEVYVDDDVVLLTNVDGEINALSGICTHAYSHLADGELEGGQIVCLLHGARFDARTGRVLCMPAVTSLRHYELRIENDDIFVSLG